MLFIGILESDQGWAWHGHMSQSQTKYFRRPESQKNLPRHAEDGLDEFLGAVRHIGVVVLLAVDPDAGPNHNCKRFFSWTSFQTSIMAVCLTQIGGEQESDVVVEHCILQYKVDDHNAEKGPKANVAHSLHLHARLVYLSQ